MAKLLSMSVLRLCFLFIVIMFFLIGVSKLFTFSIISGMVEFIFTLCFLFVLFSSLLISLGFIFLILPPLLAYEEEKREVINITPKLF